MTTRPKLPHLAANKSKLCNRSLADGLHEHQTNGFGGTQRDNVRFAVTVSTTESFDLRERRIIRTGATKVTSNFDFPKQLTIDA